MRKRKPKGVKRACAYCESTAPAVKGRFRQGGTCLVCPDCRALKAA